MSDARRGMQCECCELEYFEGVCPYCGEPFKTRWPRQRFCKPKCKQDWQNNLRQPKHPTKVSDHNMKIIYQMKARAER
jgi:hypothetical protein